MGWGFRTIREGRLLRRGTTVPNLLYIRASVGVVPRLLRRIVSLGHSGRAALGEMSMPRVGYVAIT
jgi:hypothetical protein